MLDTTKAKYVESARNFGSKHLKGKPFSDELVIDTLIEVAPSYTAKSFANLKAALRLFFIERGKEALANEIKKLANPTVIDGTTKKKPGKKKTLNKNELKIIAVAIKDKQDLPLIAAYLLAYHLGVRPSEMQSIKQTGQLTFFITGSKKSSDRKRGLDRHIHINSLSLAKTILRSINEIQGINIGNVQDRFNYLMRKLYSKRKIKPTLYTLRHQFCSELKSAHIDPHEIAYLMGHQSTRTQESYGYACSGTGIVRVKPEINLDQIKDIVRDNHSRRTLEKKVRLMKKQPQSEL